MLKISLAFLTVCGFLAGCTNVTSTTDADEHARFAAFAGQVDYPQNANAEDSRIGVATESGSIKLINFEGKEMGNIQVWVNHSFVAHLDSLPPKSEIEIPYNNFYDKSGTYFGQNTSAPVESVNLVIDGKLYNTLGPVSE